MLKIDNLKKSYSGFLLDCSLEVHSGMITGLIGKNGAGKTTLFKSVMGLIDTDGGSMKVFGHDAGRAMSVEDRQKISISYSDSCFGSYMTANDCRDFLSAIYPEFDENRFDSDCEKLSLSKDKKIKEYSTGMKARLKVIAALSCTAKLIILDEPTVGLDVIAREAILDLIRSYMEQHEDSAVVISSHIASDIETLCDDIYMINNGKIVFHEDTDKLLSDYGELKVTESRFEEIDHKYLIRIKKEPYGYSCLTNEKQYYIENYPDIVVEAGGIDELMLIMD